jgi:hypothetical protein
MMKSGINKSASGIQRSFGDWATETHFSWSNRAAASRFKTNFQTGQDELPGKENNNIASRRAAAYWESRK